MGAELFVAHSLPGTAARLVVHASIRPKFDSSRDPRRLFGQPLTPSTALATHRAELATLYPLRFLKRIGAFVTNPVFKDHSSQSSWPANLLSKSRHNFVHLPIVKAVIRNGVEELGRNASLGRTQKNTLFDRRGTTGQFSCLGGRNQFDSIAGR
jgi:hypothetical protein